MKRNPYTPMKFSRIDFGHRLKEIRQMTGLSQVEVAERCNLKPAAISHFECGRRLPSLANLRSLIQALEVSADLVLATGPWGHPERKLELS